MRDRQIIFTVEEPEPITRFGQNWRPLEDMERIRRAGRAPKVRPAGAHPLSNWIYDPGLFHVFEGVRFIESGPVEPMPEGACLRPSPDEWRHLGAGGWDGWEQSESSGGNPARRHETCERMHAHLTWGRTADHVRPWDWGRTALWYADLEVTDQVYYGLSSDTRQLRHASPGSDIVGHIERGYPTLELALGAVAWLRSCVEVAGEEGLLALNARSGGRHA